MKTTTKMIPIQMLLVLLSTTSVFGQQAGNDQPEKLIFENKEGYEDFRSWVLEGPEVKQQLLISNPRLFSQWEEQIEPWLNKLFSDSNQESLGDWVLINCSDAVRGNSSANTLLNYFVGFYKTQKYESASESLSAKQNQLQLEIDSLENGIKEKQRTLDSFSHLEARREDMESKLFELKLEIATAEARRDVLQNKIEIESKKVNQDIANENLEQQERIIIAEKNLLAAKNNLEAKQRLEQQLSAAELAEAELKLNSAELELRRARSQNFTQPSSTPLYSQLRSMLMEEEIKLAGLIAKRDTLIRSYEELSVMNEESKQLSNELDRAKQYLRRLTLELREFPQTPEVMEFKFPRLVTSI